MNTTYFINQIMGNVFHTDEDPVLPGAYYLGLSSTTPSIDGGNVTEPSTNGTGYTRILLSKLSAPANGAVTTTSDISFPKSVSSWGMIRHFVVYDALAGGNLLFSGSFSEAITIGANTVITLPAGSTILTLRSSM